MYEYQKRILNQMAEMRAKGSRMIFMPSSRKAGRTFINIVDVFLRNNKDMKPIFNKWQWWFQPLQRDYMRMERGWKIFSCGVVKIHTMPASGEECRKMHYDGFVIRFAYWLPIDRA